MTAIPFTIGRWTFPSKAAFIAHCRAILHGGDIDTEIHGTDAELVETVFRQRADKLKECGDRQIVAYHRRKHPHNTPCFHAELDDGTMLNFSFRKAPDVGESEADGPPAGGRDHPARAAWPAAAPGGTTDGRCGCGSYSSSGAGQ